MTYGYIRVSSDKQTVENQRFEINNFCKKENLTIDGWIEETISGMKNYDKRKLGDDIQSKVLAFAFGLSAEIERNLISQRTKEALAMRRANGVTLGRKIGARNVKLNQTCCKNHDFIVSQLQDGISVPNISKTLRIAKGTLYRYLAYTGIKMPQNKENDSWKRGIY